MVKLPAKGLETRENNYKKWTEMGELLAKRAGKKGEIKKSLETG